LSPRNYRASEIVIDFFVPNYVNETIHALPGCQSNFPARNGPRGALVLNEIARLSETVASLYPMTNLRVSAITRRLLRELGYRCIDCPVTTLFMPKPPNNSFGWMSMFVASLGFASRATDTEVWQTASRSVRPRAHGHSWSNPRHIEQHLIRICRSEILFATLPWTPPTVHRGARHDISGFSD
jgi:hypothetical protein